MSGPGAVLVVDDNPANLKLLRVALVAEGLGVETATNAAEAEVRIRAARPSLILMDLQMPGVDGLTFTRKLKADPATKDIAIIAVTAYAMKGDRERALEAGCEDYFTKPIDTRVVPKLVAARVRKAQPK